MNCSLFLYRLYDVASEIDLTKAETILSHSSPSRLRLSKTAPHSIVFQDAPITVTLAVQNIQLEKWTFPAEVRARLYSSGIVSILFTVPLPESVDYDTLTALSPTIANFPSQSFSASLSTILQTVKAALIKEHSPTFQEDLTIYYFRQWQNWDPVPLLLGDPGPFSDATRKDALTHRLSYSEDFTILTWDTAIVYDPSGTPDIPDLLEFANAHLLELQYYDALLEREISRLYDAMTGANRGMSYRKLGQLRALRRQSLEFISDITLITGKIRNSLRITEDVFYAKVYRAYLDVLREEDLEYSLQQKTELVQNCYTILNDEIVSYRSEILEIIIILLIAFEIILSLSKYLP